MARTHWDDLPTEVRNTVRNHTGRVLSARTASEGLNSEIALLLQTADGPIFVKGRPNGGTATSQRREAAINPYVRHVAPRLLWQAASRGWDLLGFEHIPGRHADYAPGSDDLEAVVEVLRRLGETRCPVLPEVKYAEQRWSGYLDDPDTAHLLAGETLLHTDFNPLNVLVHGQRARVIDWAWPTRGAAFIDPACWLVRLIAAGHSPDSAEQWALRCPAFATAPEHAITVFARATCRTWAEIEQNEPVPWKQDMAKAAQQWRDYREEL
jgi:hypothetical protein